MLLIWEACIKFFCVLHCIRFLIVHFDFLSGILPDDTWIDNTEFPVENFEIPEHNVVTAREVLEETILSPAENLLGTTEELDHFFPEEFINLAAIESNMNSLYTQPTNQFDTYVFNAEEKNKFETPCMIQNNNMIQLNPVPSGISEPVPDFDSIAVVPNVIPASPLSVPDSPVDEADSGVLANNFTLDQLHPEIVALLESLEKSVEMGVNSNHLKRAAEEENCVPKEEPAYKKKKLQSCSSTDEESIPDKVVERRIKNNAASRVCRASRKARHAELFRKEKELAKENEELTTKVNELSATVEYLRNYLVTKLSGQ